jgi:hypothetical protein
LLGGKVVHVAFGTTKYCSFFLRSTKCPNTDCVYLHYIGGENDSFTKEDMSQGKHLLTSARRVSKYHPNFMNGREFSNEDSLTLDTTSINQLTKSVDIPRVKIKKHHRSRSQGESHDHEETYYQDWQERFIDDSSDVMMMQEKKVKRKSKEESQDILFNLPKSFQAWFKLLLLDSSATPPLKLLNNFRKIWTVDGVEPSQSRFAFARVDIEESRESFTQHTPLTTEINFQKPIQEQMYVNQYNSNWSPQNSPQMRNWEQSQQTKVPQKSGGWNYDNGNYHGSSVQGGGAYYDPQQNGMLQNKWQPQSYPRDAPPGL